MPRNVPVVVLDEAWASVGAEASASSQTVAMHCVRKLVHRCNLLLRRITEDIRLNALRTMLLGAQEVVLARRGTVTEAVAVLFVVCLTCHVCQGISCPLCRLVFHLALLLEPGKGMVSPGARLVHFFILVVVDELRLASSIAIAAPAACTA